MADFPLTTSPVYPWHAPVGRELHALLVQAYALDGRDERTRALAAYCGISLARAPARGTVMDLWHWLLDEAARAGKLGELSERVLADGTVAAIHADAARLFATHVPVVAAPTVDPPAATGRRPAVLLAIGLGLVAMVAALVVALRDEPPSGGADAALAEDAAVEDAPAPAQTLTWIDVPPGPARLRDGSITSLTHGLRVARTEITQQQWAAVMGTSPSLFHACGADCPVERVSWYDAAAFANALSRKERLTACYDLRCPTGVGAGCPEGRRKCEGPTECQAGPAKPDCDGYRLPTRVEWARLAGGGVEGPIWGDRPLEVIAKYHAPAVGAVAWYGGNSVARYHGAWACKDARDREVMGRDCGPQPVATRAANPFGVYDVLGNVHEWLDGDGPTRPQAGGGWASPAERATLSAESPEPPAGRYFDVGFRVLRTRP